MKLHRRSMTVAAATLAVVLALIASLFITPAHAQAATSAHIPVRGMSSFIHSFHSLKTIASTLPANNDVNPYGIVVVPRTIGRLYQGDVLVSNFNNSQNLQGTGTTIVEISPDGKQQLFASISFSPNRILGVCPGGIGLTTALAVLRTGWVIVGSLPTRDGTSATARAGCLIVINDMGQVVETWSGNGINGPWDMTAVDMGSTADLFVTNVLNGTVANSPNAVNKGTVLRIPVLIPAHGIPQRLVATVVGSGFPERTDPAALVIGPTGVGFGRNDTLYVADSLDNRIAAIPNALFRSTSALTGLTVTTDGVLNDPLGLTVAPNGDILTVNGNDGNLVETTPLGAQTDNFLLDSSGSPPGAGALFGLVVKPDDSGIYYVDDATNTLNLFF